MTTPISLLPPLGPRDRSRLSPEFREYMRIEGVTALPPAPRRPRGSLARAIGRLKAARRTRAGSPRAD